MSTSDVCVGCQKPFKRLATHLAQNAGCASHYSANDISAAAISTISNDGRVNTSNVSQGATRSRLNWSSTSSRGLLSVKESGAISGEVNDELRVEDVNEFEDDFVGDDDAPHNVHVDDQDVSEKEEEECQADHSVFNLYEKMFKLRSNPLGLDRFSREEKVQIELLQLLRDLNCPLKAFTLVLNWAAKSNANGHVFQEGCQPTREKVMRNLNERYNMNGLIPKEKHLYLPYSQRTVSMVFFDASEVFASLLLCPTLNKDENYLFDDAKDPFVAPSRTLSHVGDINTGRCYRKTYDALIKEIGVDMLLPSVMAMDKTHIDMAGRLQMEPITLSHGLLKHVVRRLPIAMRILGYINHSTTPHLPSLSEQDTKLNAPAVLLKGTKFVKDPLQRNPNVTWPTYLLNEAHMQIQFILEESGFLRLQKHGFRWNLHYLGNIHRVVFHPFVPFIIGDTEGHDRLCGHYTARFAQIQQLCRICECPTSLTGYSKSKFPHRHPKAIDALVQKAKTHELKLLSQNYLKNGFAEVRFGLHNRRGIFGACPGEMLHLISLGWFKYCLEAFSAQAGPKSVALKQYDMLCANLGIRLSRQSDRDIPRINFTKGFSTASNLMGHEMAGCLLVKLFAMHTTYFRGIFAIGKKRKAEDEQRLRNEKHIADWILVVSSLLTWFQWMKQPTISKRQVKGSHAAVQWLMRFIATVAPRIGGMTNNTIKRHLVLHLCEDILDHGVPDNVNSAYAESAHITLAKVTSRNTQKRAISFTKQAAQRYVENLVVSLASADVKNDITLKGASTAALGTHGTTTSPTPEIQLSGGKSGRDFILTWAPGNESATFKWQRPRSSDDLEMAHLSCRVTTFLANYCMPWMPNGKVPCFTSFIDANGERYRAHPSYDGKVWNDYAMVKWKGFSFPFPAFIHTFVDLRELPKGRGINIVANGQGKIGEAGLYALIHSFDPVREDDLESPNTLVGHYTPHFYSDDARPTLFLVHVKTIQSPLLGIADVPFGVKLPRRERHHLFLIRRKKTWPRVWDSMIDSCRSPIDTDDTVFEDEYEKVVVMADGTRGSTVKTADDFAKEVAAELAAKKRKDAEKKKKDAEKNKKKKDKEKRKKTVTINTVETVPANTTAAQPVTRQPVGQLKGPPRKRSKR